MIGNHANSKLIYFYVVYISYHLCKSLKDRG